MRSDSHFRYIPMHRVDSLTSVRLFTIYAHVNKRESPNLQPKVTVCWLLVTRFSGRHSIINPYSKKVGGTLKHLFFFFFLFPETTGRASEEGCADQATNGKGRRSSTGRGFRRTAKQKQLN